MILRPSFSRNWALKMNKIRKTAFGLFFEGYRTFRVGFNADGASVYRASLAFIFFEKIYKGGQNVLVKSLKTLANTGEIGFYFFIRT